MKLPSKKAYEKKYIEKVLYEKWTSYHNQYHYAKLK
jgi:hypothetical protein